MKIKVLSTIAGLAALFVASQANAAGVLLKGYYNFYGVVTAATAGCSAVVGTPVTANVNFPGFLKPGFAIAIASAGFPSAVVANGFPATPNAAGLTAGWAGNFVNTAFVNSVAFQGPNAGTFVINLTAVANGVGQGNAANTFSFNIPAINCATTWLGTIIYSGA